MNAPGQAGGPETLVERRIRELWERLDSLALADADRLRVKLVRLREDAALGRRVARELDGVEEVAGRSAERVERRLRCILAPRFPEDLPLSARRAEIADAIRAHPVVIVSGDTGSGKSTQLPKICLELGRGGRGRIGCTQPRRIAAASVARRVAAELGVELGTAVGYQVRFDDQTTDLTRVKFMTDGILLAETQGDPCLWQYDTLIVDEAHERSLNVDFLLGYLNRLRPRRPDLKIVISSATLDVGAFRAFFNGAPHIHVEGRTHPIEDVHMPPEDEDAPLSAQVGRAVEWIDELDERGDILVFLPGERQIREAADLLLGRRLPGTEVLPLYARLSMADQQRVFQPGTRRRIVLATNVAETSLTIPRIRFVIDSGLARISRFTGQVQRLQIEPVSQASARQRRGRCGRVTDGVCVRLYSGDDLEARPEFTDPEIRRSSLAAVILQMKALGLGEIEQFPFLDAPRPRNVREGYRTLEEIGAIDPARELTALGLRLARLPVDPRLGRMILHAPRESGFDMLGSALVIASGLSIQDPRERPADRREEAERAHARLIDPESDFVGLLRLWDWFQGERRAGASGSRLRRFCRDAFLNARRMFEWENLYAELAEAVAGFGWRPPAAADVGSPPPVRAGGGGARWYAAFHRCVVAGVPSHIARRDEGREYCGAGGRRLHLFPGSGLFQKPPPWIVAFELVETARLYARQAARIDPVWVEQVARHLCRSRFSEAHWDRAAGIVSARESVTAFGLTLVDGRRVHFGRVDPAGARAIFLRNALAGDDLGVAAPFLEHNRRIVDVLRCEEAKLRRPDTILDADALADFYRERVPPDICARAGFESWRAAAEHSVPGLLFADPERLVREGAVRADPRVYPDTTWIGGREFAVRYRHEPGETDDGVCVDCPVEHLDAISSDALDWVVPAHLEEAAVLLLKTLPKDLRIACQPLAATAAAFARARERAPVPRGTLAEALCAFLREARSLRVVPAEFDPGRLPDRLRVKVRVTGEGGCTLGVGRDLDALRRAHARHHAGRLRDLGGAHWERPALTRWECGDLPRTIAVGDGATAHPALVDRGGAVALVLFADAAGAERAHRRGVTRLFRLGDPALMKRFECGFPLPAPVRLALASLPGGAAGTIEDAVALAVDAALGNDRGAPRTAVGFAERCSSARAGLWEAGESVARFLADILDALARIRGTIERHRAGLPREGVADIECQIGVLFAPGFLVRGWMPRLAHYPRLLRALALRVERMRNAPSKDVAKLARLAGARAAAARLARVWPDPVSRPAAVERYLWLIEEYRVNLFAPEIGTAEKVSEKRLAEALAAAERVH